MSNLVSIVWFRNDLRLTHNPALLAGTKAGSVLPIFILDDTVPEHYEIGGASRYWLHRSLHALNKSLGGHLQVFKGQPLDILRSLCEQIGDAQVLWNRGYEPWQIARDVKIKQSLKDTNIPTQSFNSHLLWEPMSVLKKDGTPYKVFTPYYRKGCLQQPQPEYPIAAPEHITYYSTVHSNRCIDDLALAPTINWHETMDKMWQPGEMGAKQALAEFIRNAASAYQDQRNLPAVQGTSRLSPHLHFGEISPHQVWYAILDAFAGDIDNPHCDTYLSELGWREFSHYLLFHFPHMTHDNFNSKFDVFAWEHNAAFLQAWQTGQTGVPIVDAGMRELYQTGYMHNRVRMIVGSFLVKNLLIDWRHGERWFWDTLLDADLAANTASWQWVAGTGADAAPYFRIFNPILQGGKFDKQGEYVKRYCPELRLLPPKYIHQPWAAPANILEACKIKLGIDYPKPIVDLKQSRDKALAAFAKLKEAS